VDETQRSFYGLKFENAFLRDKGKAFETLFARIMAHGFPGDFETVRPYGSKGDLKCDGFRASDGTVFQSYAPDTMKLEALLAKIEEDFSGVLAFEELSNALYEKAGSLTVSATPNGPTVDVRIDAQRSKGITNMQIFCFDLMLAELVTKRGIGPGFLIHDSHLFDGVDERQVAKALQLGADHASAVGFQYIVTMNSDALPRDGFRPSFDIRDFLVPTRLTDATESGGLFGLRFN
jgi:hypothetical protein